MTEIYITKQKKLQVMDNNNCRRWRIIGKNIILERRYKQVITNQNKITHIIIYFDLQLIEKILKIYYHKINHIKLRTL